MTRSIATPPWWDASPSQVNPPAILSKLPWQFASPHFGENGNFEALRDCETSVFLCEPKTFWIFRLWDQDRESKMASQKIMTVLNCSKNDESSKHLIKIFQDPYFLTTIRHLSIFSWVERGTVRVKCLHPRKQHNDRSQVWTQTVQSGLQCVNH